MTNTAHRSSTPDDEIAFRLSWILQRVAFNAKLDEEQGPRWGRSHETAALEWALEELGELFPEELDEGSRLVEERHRKHVLRNRNSLQLASREQNETTECP